MTEQASVAGHPAPLPEAWRARLADAGALLLVIALALAALALFLTLAGYDAPAALDALWRGAAGSPDSLASGTLVRATPLILAGLAVTVAFRAGVLNIGAEGQLLAGAAAAAAFGVAITGHTIPLGPLLPPIAALLVAGLAGAAWAWPAAWLRRRFGVLEVISTIMLNFVALHVVSYLVRGPLQETSRLYPQTDTIALAARLPRLAVLDAGTRLHLGFPLAVVAALALHWWLRSTAAGFRLRAVGAGSRAAESAGRIDVARVTTLAFVASGALAGVAGGAEVAGVTWALYENLSPGYGYTAIAVALLARLNPAAVVLTGILFGALAAGAGAMQRDADVPAVVVSIVEALVILLVLAMDRWRSTRRNRPTSQLGGGPPTQHHPASPALSAQIPAATAPP